MASLTATIVLLSLASARPFGIRKVPPITIRQIMPVNSLRYMFKSPFLEIRASNSYHRGIQFREIERHSCYQTTWKRIARKVNTFSDLGGWHNFGKERTSAARPWLGMCSEGR